GEGCEIRINGVLVDAQPPDSVLTTVVGTIEVTAPDVDFVVVTTDRLSIDGGQIAITTSTNYQPNTSLILTLVGLSLLGGSLLGFAFAPFALAGLLLAGGLIAEGAIVTNQNPRLEGLGGVLRQLIPREQMLPGRKLASFIYTRVAVNPAI